MSIDLSLIGLVGVGDGRGNKEFFPNNVNLGGGRSFLLQTVNSGVLTVLTLPRRSWMGHFEPQNS